MRRTEERIFCDCCGKEYKDNLLTHSKYYPSDPYRVNEFKLPYIVELPDDEDPNPTWGYEIANIKDICDECMDELIAFSKKFLKVNQEE